MEGSPLNRLDIAQFRYHLFFNREKASQRLSVWVFLILFLNSCSYSPKTVPISNENVPEPRAQAAEAVYSSSSSEGSVWFGPDGQPLPFSSEDQLLDFLRTARVIDQTRIPTGTTHPRKLTMEKDGIQVHAIFHDQNDIDSHVRLSDGKFVRFFRDSYSSQVAAYVISRLLGMDNVPPTVMRTVDGKMGSVQLWIENSLTEKDRIEKNLHPPNMSNIILCVYDMRVFDNLINNIDRNQTNMLFDANWHLWFIDHTRAFSRDPRLPDTERLLRCSKNLWNHLKTLNDEVIRKALAPYLYENEIHALLVRKSEILQWFEKKIALEGREKVLFTYPKNH